MRFHRNDYNDKIKHTLQHLAREWCHGLDMCQFGDSCANLPDTSVDISPLKVEIFNIYMKDGELFLLIQIVMTLKNTSEMFMRLQNNLDTVMMQFSTS